MKKFRIIFRADERLNDILLNSGAQHNVLSSLPRFLASNNSTAAYSRSFVVCLTDKGHICLNCFNKNKTKLPEYAAVELLETREGAEYIVLYTRVYKWRSRIKSGIKSGSKKWACERKNRNILKRGVHAEGSATSGGGLNTRKNRRSMP